MKPERIDHSLLGNSSTLLGNATISPVIIQRPISKQWMDFIDLCTNMRFGEVELLKIHNGEPMEAQLVTRKVKFN